MTVGRHGSSGCHRVDLLSWIPAGEMRSLTEPITDCGRNDDS